MFLFALNCTRWAQILVLTVFFACSMPFAACFSLISTFFSFCIAFMGEKEFSGSRRSACIESSSQSLETILTCLLPRLMASLTRNDETLGAFGERYVLFVRCCSRYPFHYSIPEQVQGRHYHYNPSVYSLLPSGQPPLMCSHMEVTPAPTPQTNRQI